MGVRPAQEINSDSDAEPAEVPTDQKLGVRISSGALITSGNTLHALPTRLEPSTFLILSVATLARCIAVERHADIGAAGLPLQIVRFSRRQLRVTQLLLKPTQDHVRPAPPRRPCGGTNAV